MKKFLIALALTALAATSAFAFDPSLVTHDGLSAKAEAEVNTFGLKGWLPNATLQLYGAGATYGIKSTGTKVGLSAGAAVASIDKLLVTRDYNDTTPYLSLGVTQQVYDIAGVKLGIFADGTLLFRVKDVYSGIPITISNTNLVRTGAIAQYEVIKDLNIYGGINGQWVNGTLRAKDIDFKQSVTNTSEVAGFAGVKYEMGPYAIDLNAGCADRFHAAANVSYNF